MKVYQNMATHILLNSAQVQWTQMRDVALKKCARSLWHASGIEIIKYGLASKQQ
jgi:hypothetical protein